MKQITIAALVVLILVGCNQQQALLDTTGVTRIEIRDPKGETVVTDAALIKELADAMLKGKPDNGVYDTAKNIVITAYTGNKITWRIRTGSPFVDFNGQQYRCPEFHVVLQKITTRPKTDTQPKPDAIPVQPPADQITFAPDPSNPSNTLVSVTFKNPVETGKQFEGKPVSIGFHRVQLKDNSQGQNNTQGVSVLEMVHNTNKTESTCSFAVPTSRVRNYTVTIYGVESKSHDEAHCFRKIELKYPNKSTGGDVQ